MAEAVISVKNLSKRYRIGNRENACKTFGDAVIDLIAAPARNLKSLRQLSNFSAREGVTSSADVIWALKDVTFDLTPGEVLGVIGRNGAGKTTLLKILSRITRPSAGTVEMSGRVSSLLEVGTGFHPELSGRENIFLNGAILGMRKAEIKKKFAAIVDFAGVEKFIDTPVKRYSSGMYVRLAFAVASHLDPDILIVDEVLAVGDAEFQKKCMSRMSNVSQDGRTILLVSHNMYAIKALCNRCILLEQGNLVADALPPEVIKQYLDAGFISRAERMWSDPREAPRNQAVVWVGARIRSEQGKISADIKTDESFTVELDYCNLNDGARMGTTVAFFNGDGVHVLSSLSNHCPRWHNRPREKGVYRSICRISGKLLAEGKYSITFFTWADNYSALHREDNVLEFHLHESGAVKGDYYDKIGGVINPLFEWETYKI